MTTQPEQSSPLWLQRNLVPVQVATVGVMAACVVGVVIAGHVAAADSTRAFARESVFPVSLCEPSNPSLADPTITTVIHARPGADYSVTLLPNNAVQVCSTDAGAVGTTKTVREYLGITAPGEQFTAFRFRNGGAGYTLAVMPDRRHVAVVEDTLSN